MSVKSVIAKIRGTKHFEIFVAVAAVAVMLVIYVSTLLPGKSEADAGAAVSGSDYCTEMERALTETVSALKGAGKTKAVIRWESGVEAVIAYVSSTGGNTSTSSPQIVTGADGSGPIVLKEIYPKALGAIIICEGGNNVRVKLDIINAVSVLLDLTPENICVYPMEK